MHKQEFSCRNQRDEGMNGCKMLANKVQNQGKTLLVDKVHEQKPQRKWLHFAHVDCPYVSSSGMADATIFYCYIYTCEGMAV